jgi:WhiB family redox-sensing transcriptional regulator
VALTSSRTAPLLLEDDDWRDVAACRDTDPDLFFPVGTTGPALEQIASAKAVCGMCDAQDSGVWGGTSEEERRQIRRARQRRAQRTA